MFRRRNTISHGTPLFEISGPHSAKSSSAPKTMRRLPQPYSPVSISKQDRPLSGYPLLLRTSMPTNKGVSRDTTLDVSTSKQSLPARPPCRDLSHRPTIRYPDRIVFRCRNIRADAARGAGQPASLELHPSLVIDEHRENLTALRQDESASVFFT